MAERRLRSGVAESMSIPMPELLNDISEDGELDEESNEVNEKDRRYPKFLCSLTYLR